jgi:purine-nucleoside phosphorylase
MSIHIEAGSGDIAATVLLPGDPLRAQYVAENMLENAACYSRVRGMFGYTGTYEGRRVSIQGTGMGIPSISIYVHELINDFRVRRLIRVGTCGALQPELQLGDLVLAQAVCTDSAVNRIRFQGQDYAPAASFSLLSRAYERARELGMPVRVGSVLTSDTFYGDDPDGWKLWARYGVLAVEMESCALYTLAARHGVEALSVLTVSDSLVRGEKATSQERQQGFTRMIEIALKLAEPGEA